MDSTVAYRMSLVLPPQTPGGGGPRYRVSTSGRPATMLRPQTFWPVDWPAMRQMYESEQTSQPFPDGYDGKPLALPTETEVAAEEDEYGLAEGVRRMLTVFPYRDASWVPAMLFVFGTTAIFVASFFKLMPVVDPGSVFPGEAEVALPVTIAVGAAALISGGGLSILAAFNVNRGPVPVDKAGRPVPGAYHPALLGSREWVWFPGLAELGADFLPNLAFRGGFVAWCGGMTLGVAAVSGLPGVLDPKAADFPRKIDTFILTPLLVGASFIFTGSLMLALASQDRWYKPAVASVAWHASFANVLAAACLAASASLGLFAKPRLLLAATANSLAGVFFLIGALLQWFVVMKLFPPNPD
ncbi:hypothetical protein CDD83_2269 [Cordyceps sp. RAO-2017]|nr:hypothetical protein CDD83_2269 [Cordyceps sp. RAO-2017]